MVNDQKWDMGRILMQIKICVLNLKEKVKMKIFFNEKNSKKFFNVSTGCPKKLALEYLTIVSTSDYQEHLRVTNRF